MRSTISWLVSIVTIPLLAVSCSARWDPATQSRINHVCSQTPDYYLCRDIFNAHLFNNVSDFKALTQIALSQTLIYTGDTLIFMKKSERNETDQTLKGFYNICGKDYNVVLNQFQFGTLAFARGDIKSMLSDIGSCEGSVDDCENVLGGKESVVHDKNSHARVLVRMSNVSGKLIGSDLIIQ